METKRRKLAKDRKRKVIPIRVTDEQKRILTKKAANRGLAVSSWLLSLGLAAPEQPGNESR